MINVGPDLESANPFLGVCVCIYVGCVCVGWVCTGCMWGRGAPLSMEFSRQDTGACFHLLLQGTKLSQGTNPHLGVSCVGRQTLYHCTTWEAHPRHRHFHNCDGLLCIPCPASAVPNRVLSPDICDILVF